MAWRLEPAESTTELRIRRIAGLRMVTIVTGVYFKPQERNEPFGQIAAFPDGRRSVPQAMSLNCRREEVVVTQRRANISSRKELRT